MKLITVPFLFSVAGCHSLQAVDANDVDSNGFRDAVMRQLKMMQEEKCRCPYGFEHDLERKTCIKSIEGSPEEMCTGGKIVDGLCLTPTNPALECPDGHLSVCKVFDRVESPCCAKADTADKVHRCRDGADSFGDECKRVVVRPARFDCPDGYDIASHHTLTKESRPQCIKREIGEASASCSNPDILAPDGESCITTVRNRLQYQCPEGYECAQYPNNLLSKYESPLCSACVKIEQHPPTCGCGEGQEEADGFCFDASTFHICQGRLGIPLKQAPPTKFQLPNKLKQAIEGPPQVRCAPLERVPCTCNHPFTLSCNGNHCTCTHNHIVPVQPVCNGITDENGECLAEVHTRPIYRCQDGFICDPIDKTGGCRCIRILTAEPTSHCDGARQEGDMCHDVVSEPKTHGCPPGYTENCCDSICSCTKTTLAPRMLKCATGATSMNGQCFFVSQPSTGCVKGNLRSERCVQEFMSPPICT